jgi:hypothetical protein
VAQYVPTFDIWAIPPYLRPMIQPGQHVTAGPGGPRGVFLGGTERTQVVAWQNHRSGSRRDYIRALRDYAHSLRKRRP